MIRVMTAGDYDQVYDLWRNTEGMGLNTVDDSQQGIERFLLRNPTTCFVAEEQDKIIGAVIAGHDGRRGYIYHAAVSQKHRRKGIATALLEKVTVAFEKEGISKCALVVFARNEEGNAFWKAVGFENRTDLVYRNKALKEMTRIDT